MSLSNEINNDIEGDNNEENKGLEEFRENESKDDQDHRKLKINSNYSRITTKLSKFDYSVMLEGTFVNSKMMKVKYDVSNNFKKGSWIGLYDKYEMQNEKYLKFKTLTEPEGSFYFEGLSEGTFEIRYFPDNDGKLININAATASYGNLPTVHVTQSSNNVIKIDVDLHGETDGSIRLYQRIKKMEGGEENMTYIPTSITQKLNKIKSITLEVNRKGDFVVRVFRKSCYVYYRRVIKMYWEYVTQCQSDLFTIE